MEGFKYCMEIESNDLNSASSDQFSNCFFTQTNNWETNNNNSDPYESALSSIVSSPATLTSSGDGIMITELIGRLGNICNNSAGDYAAASATNSCYATPLNSPPKLNLSMRNLPPSPAILSPFAGDPGFAERAAKNSLFGAGGQLGLVRSLGKETGGEFGDCSREGSSVSDQIIPADNDGGAAGNARKRKSGNRGRAAAPKESSSTAVKVAAAEEKEESKRSKKGGVVSSGKGEIVGDNHKKQTKESAKLPPEAPKDYIHVRARRGQATDSHSLAERVRREKISERMKFLQDLVPGCNKVTGKAVMLDEIINYVQSLQRQVEFLSMKLSTVNPRMEFNMEALLSKDIFQTRGSLPHGIYPLDASSLPSFPFGYQHQSQQLAQLHNTINDHTQFQSSPQAMHRNPTIQLGAMDGFAESAQQVSTFFEDDLQSVVQMGFGQIQHQSFQGSMASAQMKVEL